MVTLRISEGAFLNTTLSVGLTDGIPNLEIPFKGCRLKLHPLFNQSKYGLVPLVISLNPKLDWFSLGILVCTWNEEIKRTEFSVF